MRSSGTRLLAAALAPILLATLIPESGPNHHKFGPLDDFRSFAHPLHGSDAAAVVANVALFVPLGIVLGLGGLSARRAVLIGFCLSTAIELTQLLIPGRTTSTDDVISNTLGCAIGWALLLSARRAAGGRRRRRRARSVGREALEHTR